MSKLTELYQEIAACAACDLARTRCNVVPGQGAEDAQIMFIGEAPGWREDQQGQPFVGAAGKLLTDLLASIGLQRTQVYIANIVKCRPPNNRDPLPAEIQACSHFLERQLALIKPRVVVTLGRHSMNRFFPGQTISKVHGTSVRKNGIIYFAMYHPAAALHQPALRSVLEADMRKIPEILAGLPEQSSDAEVVEQRQLSLF